MTRLFTGDFSTGDFSQWYQLANKVWSGFPEDYVIDYPLQAISEDKDCGYIARFEVRQGDIPTFGGSERSEVFGHNVTEVLEGETVWYAFSVKFDESFPSDHLAEDSGQGWGIVAQWHDAPGGLYSPVISWGWGGTGSPTDGYWWLLQNPQNPAGTETLPAAARLLQLPLDRGEWHDIKMQMKISSDPAQGFVRVWWNGEPQTLLGGSTTFTGQTVVPGVVGVHTQIGYYRHTPTPATGILYHTGFRMADTEDTL